MADQSKKSDKSAGSPQPGAVISPGGEEPQETAAPDSPDDTQAPEEPSPTPFAQAEEPGGDTELRGETITWTASEFIHHHKSAGWYASLALATLILAAFIFLLMRDVISVGVVLAVGVLMGIFGSHQPRELEYGLDASGITIGDKQYAYSDFRSFAVLPEGAFSSIVLMPLKRFALPATLYFDPDDEKKIIDALANQLPLETHKPDALDRLLRRIRF